MATIFPIGICHTHPKIPQHCPPYICPTLPYVTNYSSQSSVRYIYCHNIGQSGRKAGISSLKILFFRLCLLRRYFPRTVSRGMLNTDRLAHAQNITNLDLNLHGVGKGVLIHLLMTFTWGHISPDQVTRNVICPNAGEGDPHIVCN
jgi:hypothetical protein